MRKKKTITINEYLQTGVYVLMRKCPTAHLMLGCSSVWDLSSTQFKWIIENLSEEFKQVNKNNKK